MNKIHQIYKELLKLHGKQGWWPITPPKKKIPEYFQPIKSDKQRLEIIFGSILTQNTQWKPNVENAIIELNKLNLINISNILKTEHEIIAIAIKSSGYFNQKAKKLRNMAKFLKKYPMKKLISMKTEKARELLLEVNGVGPETADSIILYALNKPIFVVDAYTKRIFSEINIISPSATYNEIQDLFFDSLPKDAKLFNDYHALIVQHAKKFYSKKPYGRDCPLKRKERKNENT